MADLTPIPTGIPWDPWDPSLPHSHAHLYCRAAVAQLAAARLGQLGQTDGQTDRQTDGSQHRLCPFCGRGHKKTLDINRVKTMTSLLKLEQWCYHNASLNMKRQ